MQAACHRIKSKTKQNNANGRANTHGRSHTHKRTFNRLYAFGWLFHETCTSAHTQMSYAVAPFLCRIHMVPGTIYRVLSVRLNQPSKALEKCGLRAHQKAHALALLTSYPRYHYNGEAAINGTSNFGFSH